MRNGLIVLWMLLCSAAPAMAQVRVGMGFPDASIEINLSLYPELVRIQGYPVYYAPRLVAASTRVGPMEPQFSARAGSAAFLSTKICR